ncbi:MAG TPA: DUF2116 family Zn-ribbon domain-containing protein [Thermoplasmata archaeon]|nr:DUF2116 family Zn-ribbon domain-containing protein [Thermoplasmata archaeon]
MSDLDDHRHCKVCGKVVDPQDEFCSKGCRRKRDEQLQNRRNLTYLIYASIAFVILITVLSSAGRL